MLFLILFISSCAIFTKSDLADETLFSINHLPTSADEFLYVYEKNNFNNDSIYTEKDVDEYFDLFINFKLKVEAAKTAGIDTTKSFLDEFETYKDQLIEPYLTTSVEQEKLVEQAYKRMKYEVDASHILVTVGPEASPEDTIKAYQKMLEIFEKAKSGDDFGVLAQVYSEDPSAKSNKGRLGYFTVFQMVFPFEDAAYTTPIDSISGIIRSRFGYHIIKVHDKRPYSGKVKVSHIMLGIDGSQQDTTSIRNKIFEIHDQIVGGADWNELCERYSDDQRTKNNGGTLPFIGLRQINDAAFENIAFNLQYPGEVSDPVRSKFGWHIIKLEEKQGLESFEAMKEELVQRVSKDDRSKLATKAVISRLKKEHNFTEFSSVRNQVVMLADSSLLVGNWNVDVDESLINDSLFSINNTVYKVNSFISNMRKKQQKRTGINPQDYMHELIDKYIEQSLFTYEEEQLIKNNRDFRMLLNEYYEGILLFDIMNQKVWGKAVEDTLGLREFFNANQHNYYWGKRVNAAIFSTDNKNVLKELRKSVLAESYTLLAIDIDPRIEIDVLTNTSLDSMLHLFKKYSPSTITFYANEGSSGSALYGTLKKYFEDLGIADSSLKDSSDALQDNKIRLVLNSRSKKSLEYLYNKESALTLQVVEGLFESGDNPLIDSVNWQPGIYEVATGEIENIVVIYEVLENQPKKLKDVKGLVISDYQNYLEKNWLEELKKEYTVEINERTLDKIKKAYRKRSNTSG